jgi:hypothetical protein
MKLIVDASTDRTANRLSSVILRDDANPYRCHTALSVRSLSCEPISRGHEDVQGGARYRLLAKLCGQLAQNLGALWKTPTCRISPPRPLSAHCPPLDRIPALFNGPWADGPTSGKTSVDSDAAACLL